MIGLLHIYYVMYFNYFLLFVILVLSLDKRADVRMYLSLSVMSCISAELLYVCQTVAVWNRKLLSNQATSDITASYIGLAEIGSSHKT